MTPRRLPPWSWHGAAALLLAASLGAGYAVVLVVTAVRGGDAGEAAQLLDHLGGILAGALAGWLGGSAVAADRQQPTSPSAGEAEHPNQE